MIDKEHHWCNIEIWDSRLADRGGQWLMHPISNGGTAHFRITPCQKLWTQLSEGYREESIGHW